MAQPPDKTTGVTPGARETGVKPVSGKTSVDAFLETLGRSAVTAQAGRRGRLIFALDATMSRQPTWDLAIGVQERMYATAAALGGHDVQLVYFRGFGECRASRFVADGKGLADLMRRIACQGGHTQIARVLEHVRANTREKSVGALVYVGVAMEENPVDLAALAGVIGLLGV
ncbi:MAG: hypothetical protein JWN93_589 [Hyphomicrobiales bacterium]|nr:hypothetical protein [Hyphomicrobiales bacterium]